MSALEGRTVVLGVTGGIAAYKACTLTSMLRKHGALVHVIMTHNATKLVAPLTFETLSNHPAVTDTFARPETWEVEHIALAKAADVFVIAPATANIMAKMAHGIADDMLSTTVLATKAPVLLAPAMNTGMWTAQATMDNVALLKARGVRFVGPDSGFLACGDTGAGRMSEPEEILEAVIRLVNPSRDLEGLHVMVTAGATREPIDPVRFLTNHSSGKMGIAIAEAARDRGADVTLICGTVSVPVPEDIHVVPVETTQDLHDAAVGHAPEMDIVIQAAAPADFRPAQVSDQKIKKQDSSGTVTLTLVENPDVAAAIGARKHAGQTLVGFAAETQNVLQNAQKKLQKKRLDLIVANDVTQPGAGFHVDTNVATFITRDGIEELPMMLKTELAHRILDKVLELRA